MNLKTALTISLLATASASANLAIFGAPLAGTYGLGDANFDESIDFNDLLIVAQNYESNASGLVDAGDFNLDGIVNFNDLLVVAQNYGTGPTGIALNATSNFESDWRLARSIVPEPTTLAILCLGCSGLLKRGFRT